MSSDSFNALNQKGMSDTHINLRKPISSSGTTQSDQSPRSYSASSASYRKGSKVVSNLYLTSKYGSAERTPAQRAFSKELHDRGGCSHYMAILFFFLTWLYCVAGIFCKFLFEYNPIKVRCLVPELEPYFTYDQIVNLTRTTKEDHANLFDRRYCRYYNWNYTALLKEHNYKYKSMYEHIMHSSSIPELLPCNALVSQYLDVSGQKIYGGLSDMIIQDNLICKYRPLINTIRLAPMCINCVLTIPVGILGDIYGRKIMLYVAGTIQIVGCFTMVLPSVYSVLVGQVLAGSIESMPKLAGFALEMCNRKTRVHFTYLPMVIASLDDAILAFMLFCIPVWRCEMLIVLTLFSVNIFLMWYIDESPRWLFYTGRVDEAWDILRANFKNVKLPSGSSRMKADTEPTKLRDIFYFYRKPIFRSRIVLTTLLMFFVTSQAITTYKPLEGTKLSLVMFHFIMGVSEAVCMLVIYVILTLFSRKTTMLTAIILVTFINVTIFMNSDEQSQLMSMLVVLLKVLTRAVCLVFLFIVVELYPTRYRCTSLGLTLFAYKSSHLFIYFYESVLATKSKTFGYIPVLGFATSAWLLSYLVLEPGSKDVPDLEREVLPYVTVRSGSQSDTN